MKPASGLRPRGAGSQRSENDAGRASSARSILSKRSPRTGAATAAGLWIVIGRFGQSQMSWIESRAQYRKNLLRDHCRCVVSFFLEPEQRPGERADHSETKVSPVHAAPQRKIVNQLNEYRLVLVA